MIAKVSKIDALGTMNGYSGYSLLLWTKILQMTKKKIKNWERSLKYSKKEKTFPYSNTILS